jgi:hypothetical protein
MNVSEENERDLKNEVIISLNERCKFIDFFRINQSLQ